MRQDNDSTGRDFLAFYRAAESLREDFKEGGALERALFKAQEYVRLEKGWPRHLGSTPVNINDLGAFLRIAVSLERHFSEDKMITAGLAVTRAMVLVALLNQPEIDTRAAALAALEAFESLAILWACEQSEELARLWDTAGIQWGHRPDGDRAFNVDRSIECFQEALKVLTREGNPQGWVASLNNLGSAFMAKQTGTRAENLETALLLFESALTAVSVESDPIAWARLQSNLGNVFAERLTGEKSENQVRSIRCFSEALTVRTFENDPYGWARTTSNLAQTYLDYVGNDLSESIEQSINLSKAALPVLLRSGDNQQSLQAISNLAKAYGRRRLGIPSENLEQAIYFYEAATTQGARETNEQLWAESLVFLSSAYRQRQGGDPDENYDLSIRCKEIALEFFERRGVNKMARSLLCSLGAAFLERRAGDKSVNLSRAALYCDRARTKLTDALPYERLMFAVLEGSIQLEFGNFENAQMILEAALKIQDAVIVLRAQNVDVEEALVRLRGFELRVKNVRSSSYLQSPPDSPAGPEYSTDEDEHQDSYSFRLEEILSELEQIDNDDSFISRRIALLRALLHVATHEQNDELYFHVRISLGVDLRKLGESESGTQYLEEAVDNYRAVVNSDSTVLSPEILAIALNNMGNALHLIGERGDQIASLNEAVSALKRALALYDRSINPLEWAKTQSNLGSALSGVGRKNGDKSILNEAAATCRAALEVRSRADTPVEWAKTQTNLASILTEIGEYNEDNDNLIAAVRALEAAMDVFTQDEWPLDWARGQRNLAELMTTLGERTSDRTKLEHAISYARSALEVFSPGRNRRDWCATQLALSKALCTIARYQTETKELNEGVFAARLAVDAASLDEAPFEWAACQKGLGQALLELSSREHSLVSLRDAAEAFQAAIAVYDRETRPLAWADLQGALGTILGELSERDRSRHFVEASIAAFRSALEVFDSENYPKQWARLQVNLGLALARLQHHDSGSFSLIAALEVLYSVLPFVTYEKSKMDWADLNNNIGLVILSLASRQTEPARRLGAQEAYTSARDASIRHGRALDLTILENRLAALHNTTTAEIDRVGMIRLAVSCYQAALSVYTQKENPQQWIRTQCNLGGALLMLEEEDGETETLKTAVLACQEAIIDGGAEIAPFETAAASFNLGSILYKLAKRTDARCPDDAIESLRNATKIFDRLRSPGQWRDAQETLARALASIAKYDDCPTEWRHAAIELCNLLESQWDDLLNSFRTQEWQPQLNKISQLAGEVAVAWYRAGDAESAMKIIHKTRAVQSHAIDWIGKKTSKLHGEKTAQECFEEWQVANARAEAAANQWQSSAYDNENWSRYQNGAKPSSKSKTSGDVQMVKILQRENWKKYRTSLDGVNAAFDAFKESLHEPEEFDLQNVVDALPAGSALVTLVAAEEEGFAIVLQANSESDNRPILSTLSLAGFTRRAIHELVAGNGDILNGLDGDWPGWLGHFNTFRTMAAGSDHTTGIEVWRDWNAAIVTTLRRVSTILTSSLHRWLLESSRVLRNSEILLSPPGILSILPMGAAIDPDHGRCLLDDYAIRMVPSVHLLLGHGARVTATEEHDLSLFAVTDPLEDLLPVEKRQSPALSSFESLSTHSLTGHEATKSLVLSHLGKSTHFVYYGHGGWNVDRGRGGLFLYQDNAQSDDDGNLTEEEIRNIDMSFTRLAILAACETGLIDTFRFPEEFSGLVASFLAAGCGSVVASLWPVAANTTWTTVKDMLRRNISSVDDRQGSGTAEALRQTQLSIRASGEQVYSDRMQAARPQSATVSTPAPHFLTSSEPVFWAAFICAG